MCARRLKSIGKTRKKTVLENIGGESIRVVHPLFQEEGGGSTPTSPLQLYIGEISVVKAIDLNGLWHSRLPKVIRGNIDRNRHSVCFGAEYAGTFYASAIWSTPVADNLLKTSGGYCLELRRFAIANDAPKNTASRMLSVMVKLIRKKFPEIVRLVSYQDTAAHLGTIYKASGWRQTALSKGRSWSVNGRSRNPEQSIANKIRWERKL